MSSAYTESVLELTQEHFEALGELGDTLRQRQLSFIERNSAERSIQVLVEACIGLSKHICKASGRQILGDASANAQKAVDILQAQQGANVAGIVDQQALKHLLGAIGMRNAIVHDYLNLDWELVAQVILSKAYLRLNPFILAATAYLSGR
jgi:uncharacterized protein YutE (UPF0331/DUF86 family)